MIGTSTGEWLFIRLSIIIFRYTPCIYIASFIAASLSRGPAAKTAQVPILLLVAESIYYFTIWRPCQERLAEDADHPLPATREERRELFEKCLLNVTSLESYLRGWFLGADGGISRDNVREFLLWAFFEREEVEPDHDEMEGYLQAIERKLGRPLDPGRGHAQSLRLTFDPIETTYRSLLWYAVIFLVDLATHVVMLFHGFEYHAATERVFPPRPQTWLSNHQSPARGLGYWHKPHPQGSDKHPVVFFHGIGVGLWTYINFLTELRTASKQGIGIIAVEHLPVSFRLTSPPPTKSEFLEQMRKVLDAHRWDKFALVSHSYGSVLTTYMLHATAFQRRVTSVVLIDPVTIMLHLPNVAYNFTRRQPARANEWQLWYFASTDPGVAHCLGRHFFWRQKILWREELLAAGRDEAVREGWRAAVCLSGRDLIVETGAVAQYLAAEKGQIDVLMFPEMDHAQVFDDATARGEVINVVKEFCAHR